MATLRGGHRCFPLGTANLDRRSFFLNYEMMLLLPDVEAARQLAALLRPHLAQSQEVSVARWHERPAAERWKQDFAKLLSPLL
jgi:cardiolipin synthase